MSDDRFDLERIKRTLAEATAPGAGFSQRSLDKAADVTRGTVGEILRGKILNPTTQVLSQLATALGGDLSLFGLSAPRADLPTEDELRRALLEALPGMPRGAPDKRARYLAEIVAALLRLPPDRPATPADETARQDAPEAGAPPREATIPA